MLPTPLAFWTDTAARYPAHPTVLAHVGALGFELPPGTAYTDLDEAMEGDDAAPAECPPGDCVPCFEEGETVAALPGTDRCGECS